MLRLYLSMDRFVNWNSTNNELFRLLVAIHLGGKRSEVRKENVRCSSCQLGAVQRQEERCERKDRKTEGKFCHGFSLLVECI